MYAYDFVGHTTAAANKYRRPKTPLERRCVGEADRDGDGMVVVDANARHVELCRVEFRLTLFRGLIMYTEQMEKESKNGGGYGLL
jgi:hypothetical protein